MGNLSIESLSKTKALPQDFNDNDVPRTRLRALTYLLQLLGIFHFLCGSDFAKWIAVHIVIDRVAPLVAHSFRDSICYNGIC